MGKIWAKQKLIPAIKRAAASSVDCMEWNHAAFWQTDMQVTSYSNDHRESDRQTKPVRDRERHREREIKKN